MLKRILAILLTLLVTRALAAPANHFFAMDTIARGTPDTVVPMLKDLGYDGLGGAAGDNRMASALEAAGLRLFNGYLTLSFDSAQPALDDRLRSALDRMQGHDAALWLALQKVQRDGTPLARSSPEADEIAVAKLREIADYARARGVRVALYPHTGHWIERVEDALRVADQLDRPDVGVTFNLCHWLKVEGSERDPFPVLQAALPRLMFVTINGADSGDTRTMGWDRLIQPLGSGSYDVAAFMEKVRAAGYTGPVGFQGFGIKRDPREVLTETMAAWRKIIGQR
jgi:sugar phosphate isomerase/epimerase